MLFFAVTAGFVAILISTMLVIFPIVFILEVLGVTDLFDTENQEYEDARVDDGGKPYGYWEHPANFKRHEK